MTAPAVTRFADAALQRFAEQSRDEFLRLQGVPFLDGSLVEVPALASAGVFTVTHGLQRIPRGYLVTYLQRASGTTTAIDIYKRQGERWDASSFVLYSTGAFELLRMWVF